MGTSDTGEFYTDRTPHMRPLTWFLLAVLIALICGAYL